MISAVLAFLGALVYGGADFLGGIAARRLRSLAVTAIAAFSGLALLVIAMPFVAGVWTAADAMWGAVSGVTGVVAIVLLYACLAIGPMSILSPVTAVVSAITPMVWGLVVEQEQLAPVGYVGLAVAIVAIVLVAFLPGETIIRPSARGLAMAFGSGLAIGAFLVLIDQTSDASGLTPLVVNRAVNGTITAVIVVVLMVAATRRGRRAVSALDAVGARRGAPPSGHADLEHAVAHAPTLPAGSVPTATRVPVRTALLLAVLCGCVDAVANVLLLVALRAGGDLAVVSALTALYPAGTVLLAAVVLRERIAPPQWAGLVLALVAGAMLAVA